MRVGVERDILSGKENLCALCLLPKCCISSDSELLGLRQCQGFSFGFVLKSDGLSCARVYRSAFRFSMKQGSHLG